jgi:4-hydroxy-3-polyprenylbenzoate decarboxylase
VTRRLIVAISGASGQIYGIRLLEIVRDLPDIETHLVISDAARITIAQETDRDRNTVEMLADTVYPVGNIGAPIASGSFATMGMVVIPCSIKSLSAIANCYAADLIGRAADVQLKQGRPVILVVRETPLHLGHLRLMVQATEIGCTIMPPVPAFYNRPETLDDIVDHTVGRVLDRLGITNTLYDEWKGTQTH